MARSMSERFFEADPLPASPVLPVVTVADAIDDLPRIGSGGIATEYDSRSTNAIPARAARSGILAGPSNSWSAPFGQDAGDHQTFRTQHRLRDFRPTLITSGFSSCYSRLAAGRAKRHDHRQLRAPGIQPMHSSDAQSSTHAS